ncbi:ABC transporter substrate-binding protein [Yinghuangia seranimata]|uniref:ABC transporter substrate-binding protein n=1 Tax=Yinghuangia seranimata TaxID=408067 RepID=UPI00248C0B9E|nr:ABC transporter substrate-binding protein [Yinghuangia seranimata]MDI2125144.1 ABC transporter substrate-binding protein [Yinghuangia seranimata]
MPAARFSRRRSAQTVISLAIVPLLALATACGYGSDKKDDKTQPAAGAQSPGAASSSAKGTSASELRLGFFANVTHATPLVGLKEGFYAKELGGTKISTQVFNAGPAAIEALKGGSIDATYIGPNPSISGFTSTNGDLLRIVAGTTSGGASLVVKPGINSAADLKGKKIASPQLGGTQDVAVRAWLKAQGLSTDTKGGGDVSIVPTDNAQTLALFKTGELDGGWLPEPWATRLVQEAGAKVLVDERTLWPEGKFVTTNLVVRKKFLEDHPDTVEALVKGQLATTDWINANPDKAKADVNDQLTAFTQKGLPPAVIDAAWKNIEVTNDPLAASLLKLKDDGVKVGVTKDADIKGIYDLTILNKLLAAGGKPAVNDAGLGKK